MCSLDLWWWLLMLAMILSGAMGGLVRYNWDKLDEDEVKIGSFWRYILLGVGAALLVPLFLNTISSTLITDTARDHTKVYILIGFCLAAGIFAKKFIGSLSKKALDLSREAKEIATEAKQTAVNAGLDAKNADNRALALIYVLNKIDNQEYEDALAQLEKIIANDTTNSEAWAWLAYCCKRLNKLSEAVVAIDKALENEGRDVYGWLFNKACYQSLNQEPIKMVLITLTRAKLVASPTQLAGLHPCLLSDEDFATLRTNPEFLEFLDSLPIGETL